MAERRPDPSVLERAEIAFGSSVSDWTLVERGHTPVERWVLQTEGGRSGFAKHARGGPFAEWLRMEYLAYSRLALDCVPELLGWWDGDEPLLLIEDLSEAHWPPPWTTEQIDRVRTVLEQLSSRPAPEWAPEFPHEMILNGGWHAVSESPESFLSLGFVTAEWLRAAIGALVEWQDGATLVGDRLVHFDVRSDNICFDGSRTLLIDWNGVCRGSDRIDFTSWLPSLHTEGGPAPWDLLPDSDGHSAALSGYWAARAGLAPPDGASYVRQIQRRCLTSALAWVVQELSLAPPDGPNASEILLPGA